jgi:agmatinase
VKTPNNFLGLEPQHSNYAAARAAILPLPYEASTSYHQGTRKGPRAIISASQQVEFYDEELNLEPRTIGIATVAAPDFSRATPRRAVERIASACGRLLNDGKFVIGLGGEHTVTVGMHKAVVERFPDVWVVQLDAHSDLRPEYQGSPFSHACVMARVTEISPAMMLGIRSGIMGERERLKTPSRLLYAYEMRENAHWQDEVFSKLGRNVYLTIDLDFFNPAEMPAVGTPEPGGFGWYETLGFLRRLFLNHNVVGCDIVELCPIHGIVAPDFFAARLAHKLIAYKFFLGARLAKP